MASEVTKFSVARNNMAVYNAFIITAILTVRLFTLPHTSSASTIGIPGYSFNKPEFVCRGREYTSQLTIVKVVDKIIDQDVQTIAGIICCTTLSSNVKFSWTFVNSNQPSWQPFVIQETDDCNGKDGPYQLRDRPGIVIVCNPKFPLHQGKYTCTVKNDEMQVHASKSMFLEIRAQPTFRIIPSGELFIPYKESRELECIVIANPPAQPMWLKVVKTTIGGEMAAGGGKYIGIKKINVSWSPEAEGRYVCMAKQDGENVIKTSEMVNVTVENAPPAPSKTTSTNLVLQITYSVTPFILFSVILLVWNQIQWMRIRFPPQLTPNDAFQLDPARSVQEQAAELPYNISWEFPRLDISFHQLLGNGNGGQVWKCFAEGISGFNPTDESELSLKSKIANIYKRDPRKDFFFKYFRRLFYPGKHCTPELVAIKCLPEHHTDQDYSNLAAELKLMIHIGCHENIVNLLGACTISGPLWLIMEYCQNGDLLQFLRGQKQNFIPQWEPVDESSGNISFWDLIRIAIKISEGMTFLSKKGIVHRDLAARNILIQQNMEIKIADFGMAKDVGYSNTYHMNDEEMVPVKWMAIEALQVGAFTSKSDVWSFGVLVWEIMSMGDKPYEGIPNRDLAFHLRQGIRIHAPDHCPVEVYEVMHACWRKEATERPDFPQLTSTLTNIRSNAFKPPEDYYTGTACSERADTHVNEDIINCDEMLRPQRISRFGNNGVAVRKDNVDDNLKMVSTRSKMSYRMSRKVHPARKEMDVQFNIGNGQDKFTEN